MQVSKKSGQPVLCQLLSYIPKELVQKAVDKYQSDRYYKTMTTYRQLVFIFYGVISRVYSLNSLCKSLRFLKNKLTYLGITKLPAVSTLSDANKNRNSEVFGTLYHLLVDHYKKYLSHSYLSIFVNGEVDPQKVKLFDSSTVKLFTELFTGAGPARMDGKRKGGVKVHTVLSLDRFVPEFVWMSPASYHDNSFLGQLTFVQGYTYVFDKAYHNYQVFKEWTENDIFYVTRLKESAQYEIIESVPIDIHEFLGGGVIYDQVVNLKKGHQKDYLRARLITYKDPATGNILQFLTNQFGFQVETIVTLYKNRWLMETLFKQLKQNFELSTFYSDSRHGIKTQIWIALIAQLIFTVIHKQVKECELFSTLVSMTSGNLGSYECLISTIKSKRLSAEEREIEVEIEIVQLQLFKKETGGLFHHGKNSP